MMPERRAGRYSLQILLPGELDSQMREWCRRSPGATWPDWGGHITLLPTFRPLRPMSALEEAIRRVTSKYGMFRVRLSDVWCRPHLVKPGSCIVFVTAHRRDPAELWDMQAELAAAVGPLVNPEWVRLWGEPFRPHISLTTGLSRRQAEDLLRAACDDHLEVTFWADRVSLMQHNDCPACLQAELTATFPLANALAPTTPFPPVLFPRRGPNDLRTGRAGE